MKYPPPCALMNGLRDLAGIHSASVSADIQSHGIRPMLKSTRLGFIGHLRKDFVFHSQAKLRFVDLPAALDRAGDPDKRLSSYAFSRLPRNRRVLDSKPLRTAILEDLTRKQLTNRPILPRLFPAHGVAPERLWPDHQGLHLPPRN